MNIDELVESLQDAKKELGGKVEVFTEFECDGKVDCVKIESLSYSKIFSLRFIIKAPWWAYNKRGG